MKLFSCAAGLFLFGEDAAPGAPVRWDVRNSLTVLILLVLFVVMVFLPWVRRWERQQRADRKDRWRNRLREAESSVKGDFGAGEDSE